MKRGFLSMLRKHFALQKTAPIIRAIVQFLYSATKSIINLLPLDSLPYSLSNSSNQLDKSSKLLKIKISPPNSSNFSIDNC